MRTLPALLVLVACPFAPQPEPPPVLDPGCVVVNRERVEFGNVEVGLQHDIVVRLTNSCPIEAGPRGDVRLGSILLDRGQPFGAQEPSDRVLGPGESAFMNVVFRPDRRGDFTDVLRIDTDDPENSQIVISIAGSGGAPEAVGPEGVVDLGEEYIGCTAKAPVSIANEGDVALTIYNYQSMNPELGFGVDRRTATNGSLPFVVPAVTPDGVVSEVVVDATYRPQTRDPKTSVLRVATSGPVGVLEVPLAGAGATYRRHTDRFTYDPHADTDLLITLSRGETMEDDRASVTENLLDYAARFVDDPGQHHVALAVTDDGCVLGPDAFIDDSFDQAEAQDALLTMADMDFELARQGAHFASGFHLAAQALSEENLSEGGCNAGFRRPDALLMILHISDVGDARQASYRSFVEGFRAMTPGPGFFESHAVTGDWPDGCETASVGAGYYQAAQLSDGTFHSICDGTWGFDLQAPLTRPAPWSVYPLTEQPVAETIGVRLDGEPIPDDWTYEATGNQVLIGTSRSVPVDAPVAITYDVQPDCED